MTRSGPQPAPTDPLRTAQYRVDDLARAAGTTARNVRLYQERGLLPSPRLVGRVGWYDDTHLARLRVITRLLERGFSLANIGELLTTWESGRDLSSVLGVEQLVTVPWNDEDSAPVTLDSLREVFGDDFGPDAADRLVALGLLHRHGVRYRVPSPTLLGVAGELVAVGLPLPAVLQLAEVLVTHLAEIARGFITTTTDALAPEPEAALNGEDVEQMTALAMRLRPLAALAVSRGFSVTMERESVALLGARMEELARLRRPEAGAPGARPQRRRRPASPAEPS